MSAVLRFVLLRFVLRCVNSTATPSVLLAMLVAHTHLPFCSNPFHHICLTGFVISVSASAERKVGLRISHSDIWTPRGVEDKHRPFGEL